MDINKIINEENGEIVFASVGYIVQHFELGSLKQADNDEAVLFTDANIFLADHFHLLIPETDSIQAEVNGSTVTISAQDFVSWQLSRMPAKELYLYMSKVDASDAIADLPEDEDWEKIEFFDPESWLSSYEGEEDYANGIELLQRMLKEYPDRLCAALAEHILDVNSGITHWLEYRINGNVEQVCDIYQNAGMSGPMTLVASGLFTSRLSLNNLAIEDIELNTVHVRNYDEVDLD